MKKIFALVSALLLHVSCTKAQVSEFSDDTLKEKLTSLDGNAISFQAIINKHKGKAVLMEVWASWCGDCVKNMPQIATLQEKHKNVDFVFLSCDKDIEKWKTGIEKHHLKGDHYLIPEGMKSNFGKGINLKWIPRYILLNKDASIELFYAIETDFDTVNTILDRISK